MYSIYKCLVNIKTYQSLSSYQDNIDTAVRHFSLLSFFIQFNFCYLFYKMYLTKLPHCKTLQLPPTFNLTYLFLKSQTIVLSWMLNAQNKIKTQGFWNDNFPSIKNSIYTTKNNDTTNRKTIGKTYTLPQKPTSKETQVYRRVSGKK